MNSTRPCSKDSAPHRAGGRCADQLGLGPSVCWAQIIVLFFSPSVSLPEAQILNLLRAETTQLCGNTSVVLRDILWLILILVYDVLIKFEVQIWR